MACQTALCQECATQWDGIWHCTRCLAARRGTDVRSSSRAAWLLLGAAAALLLLAGERLMVWSGALLAGLF
jgi:hypothetical protein